MRRFLASLWIFPALAAGFALGAWPNASGRVWRQMFPAASTAVAASIVPARIVPTVPPHDGAGKGGVPIVNLAGALSRALALPAGAARDKAMDPLLDTLAGMDAEAALKLLLAQPESTARDDALLTAFDRLAFANLALAIEWTGKEPFLARAGGILLARPLGLAAAKDGPGAWALYLRWRDAFVDASSDAVIDAWVERRPEEAVGFGLAISDGIDRQTLLGRAISKWLWRDTKGFLAWARQQSEETLDTCFQGALQLEPSGSWSELAELAQLLPYEKARALRWTDLMRGALSKESDLSKAPGLIGAIPDAAIRDQGYAALVLASLERDPSSALRWLAEIADPVSRSKAAANLAGHLALKDPQAAMAMAKAEPDEAARSFAMRSAVATWLARNPAEASAYLSDHVAEFSSETLAEMARLWNQRDGPGCMAWARTLRNPEAREMVLNQIGGDWMRERPEAALIWAEANAVGGRMDDLLEGMISRASYSSAPSLRTAAAMVNLIQSPQARQTAAVNLMKRWRLSNADAAAEWHEAVVRQGRIHAVPAESQGNTQPAAKERAEAVGFLEVQKPGHLMTIGVDGRSFRYQGRGVSFTVFY